jgi:hypothetical protein
MDALAVVYSRELTRWGIETSIIVPGAFTGGTNYFAHAGSPNFQAQHDACFAQADFGNQLLKPFPIHSRGAGLPEIGVDDDDVLHGPAQGDGMLAQTVLSLGAFGIFKNLTKRRLAHIKISVSLEVSGIHFLVCGACHEVASCCRQRIMLASNVVIFGRTSPGMVSSTPGRERELGSLWGAHSDQACIQAVIPRRTKSAQPKPSPRWATVAMASRRSCSYSATRS